MSAPAAAPAPAAAAPKPDLVTVNVDGREVSVPRGTNMIEAARMVGIEVPHYCYHPKLSVVGNCRMCLVEMGMPAVDPATKQPVMDPATGKQKINWMPRPTIACATNASPGLHIRTGTELVRQCREGVMEFLLVNHPLDCPICDQAGECQLQEFATNYGRGYSRFIEEKNVKPKRTVLGPRVMLDDERCILCSRCIRFSKEIAKDDVLGFVDRGSYSTLTCYPGRKLENNYSLNTVDICPVGALTSTDFRFKMRVWFLKETDSIDTESSVGCNTIVSSREGKIYRITPRRNDDVNDTWMPDSGRELYKQVEAENRLKQATIDGAPAAIETALRKAVDLLQGGGVAVVGSGRSSVEEQFLTRKLAEAVGAVQSVIVSRVGANDGLLISEDRNPNVRGALVTGLIRELPSQKLSGLAAAIDSGAVRAVVTVGEDLIAAGLTEAQLAKVSVVYIGTHADATSRAAKVVLPGHTVFEKCGTFINVSFRLQKFARAVPGPEGTADQVFLIGRLASLLGSTSAPSNFDAVWSALSNEVPYLSGLSYVKVPANGVVLDTARSDFASLPFCETKTLKYTPPQS
jgi:NADH-quinone oxidoreductase subunit G